MKFNSICAKIVEFPFPDNFQTYLEPQGAHVRQFENHRPRSKPRQRQINEETGFSVTG